MPFFSVKSNKNNYHIFAKNAGSVGPRINNEAEANAVCNWLNSGNLVVNLYSFFSFDVSDDDENIYHILDRHKRVGKTVETKKNAVAITNFCNFSLKELKDLLDSRSYEPIMGEEPTAEEVKFYMKEHNVGKYLAIEELRKKKYKKL